MAERDADGTSGGVQDAESRFATLVKFDIVGSTQILRRLGRSDSLELVRGFRSIVGAALKPYDVKIEWEGDGALVAFGYPAVRIDAAEAAVRTALGLVEAVRAAEIVPGVRLDLRVGIASGLLTVDLRSGAIEGLSINRAERLKTLAQPGQVVVGDDTRRLVRNFFEYEDLGMIELKGFDEMTRVWCVTRATSVVSRFAARRLSDSGSEIVGRADALAQLSDAWSRSLSGHGSAVCLVGDAGMGKSRLARSILDQAERDGALVLEIDCTPSTGNSPLLPVGVLLRRTARIGPGTPEAETLSAATTLLTRLLGAHEADALTYLAPLFGIRSAPIPLDKTPEQVRAATIATIVAIVRALASQAPLALLCEDLHWADDTTAQVVQEIARNIAELRVMVIVTRWPKPVTPIDMESITATCVTVPVSPLPPATAAELVKLVGGEDLSPERIDAIVGRCGGVPLLLEEVTRSTLELPADGTEIRAARVSDSPVPPELQLVVESRLDRWPELKNIIESASVLGREFSVPLLETMVSDREGVTDVAAALSVFADHGLFAQPEPSGGDRASFRHALIRDAVYETLVSKAYVRGLHSRAADALIAGYLGTPDASPDVLAHHLRIAERLGEAIRIRLTAGDDSFKRGAYVEAKGQCEAAHELIDEVRDKSTVRSDAFRLCVLRGMVGAGVHGYSSDPVALAYSEAQSMFDEATAAGERYPVVRGLATSYLVRGELATAYRYSLDGLKLADESARPDYRIDAMSVLSYTTLYFGRLEDCRSWIDRSLQLYDSEAGSTFRYPVPQDAKTAALALLPTAAWLLGDAVGAEEAINRGLEHVDRLAREFDKALLHAWTAGTRYTQRRYLDGIRHAGIAYALGKEHRFQEWEGVGAMMALLCQSALQPAPEAVAQALAVAQEFKSRGVGLNASYFLWGIARGFVTAGNAAAAQATLDAALAVASGSQETRMNPEIWTLKAEIETDRGNAIRMLMDAFALAESQGAIANALRAASALIIRVDPGGGGVEQARAALDRLDGRTPPDPVRPLWMHEDLAQARQVVNGLESAVPRS